MEIRMQAEFQIFEENLAEYIDFEKYSAIFRQYLQKRLILEKQLKIEILTKKRASDAIKVR